MRESAGPSSNRGPPRVLLVDCDMFYVQVARREDPEGVGREPLVIVGGSADGRGVVTSASYEVRAYGVRSAMPTAEALRLCPDAVVVPVPREACARHSRAVRDCLCSLAPIVQAASIDEFYLDLTGTERMLHGETLEATGHRIREAVLERTGIGVSIGGGTRKLIAKLATRRAKPGGVHVVAAGEEEAFMRTHDLADIPGVGPALAESLSRRGLVRVDDALRVGVEWLQRWFGEDRGRWLHDRARGVDSARVVAREPRKSVSSERTFSSDLDADDALEGRLLSVATSAAAGVRRAHLRARTVTVKIRDDDFTTRQASHTVPEPIESDAAVYEIARTLLAELRRRRRRPARLLGVALSGLVDAADPTQTELFGSPIETSRDRTVSRTVDELRDRFGDRSVRPARLVRPPEDRERP